MFVAAASLLLEDKLKESRGSVDEMPDDWKTEHDFLMHRSCVIMFEFLHTYVCVFVSMYERGRDQGRWMVKGGGVREGERCLVAWRYS